MVNGLQHEDGIGSIVSVDWLANRLEQKDIVIADCRFDLADPEAGRRAYERDHIPGAIFFDLERDLSGPAAQHGGRHPLPPVDKMAALFGKAGIGDGVTVVCYDDQKGGTAGRLWWMLRYLGHRRVALLDGGYAAWRAGGLPVTSKEPQVEPRTFAPQLQKHMAATLDEVRQASASGRGTIVDSRAPERYRGEVEPLDPVAGHIPGALNMPWGENASQSGTFLDASSLVGRFGQLRDRASEQTQPDSEAIIVHCGSGVTGCVNVLAMEQAGIAGVKLYVGGWSDWCSHSDNPVATAAEPNITDQSNK